MFGIQKNIKAFPEFFKFVGLKERSEEELNNTLKNAIKNSERKKYHGELDVIHKLPNSQEQFSKILSSIPSYKTYFKVTQTEKEINKKK